jgi:hypothetical protein
MGGPPVYEDGFFSLVSTPLRIRLTKPLTRVTLYTNLLAFQTMFISSYELQ